MSGDSQIEISMDTNSRVARLEADARKTRELQDDMQKKLNDLHRRLCEPSNVGEPPLIERLGKAVRAYEQTSWLSKAGLWAILTLGSLAAATQAIVKAWQGLGK